MKESDCKRYEDLPQFLNTATVAKLLGVSQSRAGLPGTKDRQQDGLTQGAVHPLGDEHTGGGKSGTEVEPTSLCPTRSSCWV